MKPNKPKILHIDLYGSREEKFDFLNTQSISSMAWNELSPQDPNYFFVPKNFDNAEEYEKGFRVDELFIEKGSGIKFRKDNLLVKNHFCENDVYKMIHNMNTLSKIEITNIYDFKETEDWKIEEKRKLFKNDDASIVPVNYRPFDYRYTYYPLDKIAEIIPRGDARQGLMKNIIMGSIAFICFRQSRNKEIGNFWITKYIVSKDIISSLDSATIFPLYLYSPDGSRTPNLNPEIANRIAEGLGMVYSDGSDDGGGGCRDKACLVSTDTDTTTNGTDTTTATITPIDILDYIYAVLHSPTYRERYKEFLKIDFPRVPYPHRDRVCPVSTTTETTAFWQLVHLGSQLRQIHLLESPTVEQFITQYPTDGSNVVTQPRYHNSPLEGSPQVGRVYINQTQYFDNVPQAAWEFYIGGYQPAQKWLKDRKDRELEFEDIQHYQKIIVALSETKRLMEEIDEIATG